MGKILPRITSELFSYELDIFVNKILSESLPPSSNWFPIFTTLLPKDVLFKLLTKPSIIKKCDTDLLITEKDHQRTTL